MDMPMSVILFILILCDFAHFIPTLSNNVDFVLQKFKFQHSKFYTPRKTKPKTIQTYNKKHTNYSKSECNIFDENGDDYIQCKQSVFNYNFYCDNNEYTQNNSLINIYIQLNDKNISLNVSVYDTIQNIIYNTLREYNEYTKNNNEYILYFNEILLENNKQLMKEMVIMI
eukprot:70192_1